MFEKHRTTVAAMPASRFGGWIPKDDSRVLFSLCRNGEKLYFLNQSPWTLNRVRNTSCGLVKVDDEGGSAPTTVFEVTYDTVLPGEALLIDEFDDYFDAELYINVAIEVTTDSSTETFHADGKGGPSTQVLKKR